MANIDIIAATVQQLLNQTSTLLKQDGEIVIQDENLATLERDTQLAMMQLRRYRNDSVAVLINRLPPELLRIILGGLRRPPTTRSSRQLSMSRFNSYRPLISAMLVCHKWHAIASQAASLWTDIDFARQGTFAPVLLTRSLGASIRLCGRLDKKNTLVKVVADNGARIRELDLWVGTKLPSPVPVLQSILAVDMPHVRILSFSCGGPDSNQEVSPVITVGGSDDPASFPALEAMLLESFLLVPTYPLPRLTHLHLAWIDDVDPLNILSLLRNTPALEVFDITQCHEFTPRLDSAPPPPSSSVVLPRLHSMHIWSLTTRTVHALMTRIEAPALASLRLESIVARDGALASTPLLPDALAARPSIDRLAIDVSGGLTSFRTAFHGPDLTLAMDIRASGVQDAERIRWAFHDLPAVLPLARVEELHFQTTGWGNDDDDGDDDDDDDDDDDGDTDTNGGSPAELLTHLAAHTPLVSTLVLKHDEPVGADADSDADAPAGLALARAATALLTNDQLLPCLAHLELIVGDVSAKLCAALVPGLAQRARDGRRLRTLRVQFDDWHTFRRSMMRWMHSASPDYAAGLREYVDDVEIGEESEGRRGGTAAGAEGSGDDGDGRRADMLRWGKWRNCVQHARHGYWQ